MLMYVNIVLNVLHMEIVIILFKVKENKINNNISCYELDVLVILNDSIFINYISLILFVNINKSYSIINI